MTDAGHNHVESEELRLLIERVERLQEERKSLGEDVADVFREAKSYGYDTKVMKQIVRLRKLDPSERSVQEELRSTYKTALGM